MSKINPFYNPPVLKELFSAEVPLEDLKEFRIICSTWDDFISTQIKNDSRLDRSFSCPREIGDLEDVYQAFKDNPSMVPFSVLRLVPRFQFDIHPTELLIAQNYFASFPGSIKSLQCLFPVSWDLLRLAKDSLTNLDLRYGVCGVPKQGETLKNLRQLKMTFTTEGFPLEFEFLLKMLDADLAPALKSIWIDFKNVSIKQEYMDGLAQCLEETGSGWKITGLSAKSLNSIKKILPGLKLTIFSLFYPDMGSLIEEETEVENFLRGQRQIEELTLVTAAYHIPYENNFDDMPSGFRLPSLPLLRKLTLTLVKNRGRFDLNCLSERLESVHLDQGRIGNETLRKLINQLFPLVPLRTFPKVTNVKVTGGNCFGNEPKMIAIAEERFAIYFPNARRSISISGWMYPANL